LSTCVSSKGQKDCTTFYVIINEIAKKNLFSHNLVDSTPIALSEVTSSNNVVGFDGISNVNNQQPIEIDVQIINLIDFPNTKSAPLSFLKQESIGFDALFLLPPLDVSTPKTKKMVL